MCNEVEVDELPVACVKFVLVLDETPPRLEYEEFKSIKSCALMTNRKVRLRPRIRRKAQRCESWSW